MKLIIDATTGTVLNIDECYVVETDELDDHDTHLLDEASDSELSSIAKRYGKSIVKMGTDTGWGDNAYKFAVSYSPLSVKDEADAFIEGNVYVEGDSEYDALVWAKDVATIEQLEDIGHFIMNDDNVWSDYRQNFLEALMWVYSQNKEKK